MADTEFNGMMPIDRGRVIVTAASTGIGEATALHLRQLGYSVLAGVRREADAEDRALFCSVPWRAHGQRCVCVLPARAVAIAPRTTLLHRRAVPGCWS